MSTGSDAMMPAGKAKESVLKLFDTDTRMPHMKTPQEREEEYKAATSNHPFVHAASYHTILTSDACISDANGKLVCALFRNYVPREAAEMASTVLTPAATRTSLRANVFGGEAPLSGIAGYFDYAGSPIEHKCRKTSFTSENLQHWPGVYPLIAYANQLYKASCAEAWALQNKAIPDPVRIHNSVFSTLTINQRFRTAQHTDAGDFDEGYGMLTVLDGDYDGMMLGFPRLGVAVRMSVGDIIIFNTHHFHANTELERLPTSTTIPVDWSRVTCVFYYRANLGASACLREYHRRYQAGKAAKAKAPKDRTKEEATAAEAVDRFPNGIPPNSNGVNKNRPATAHVRAPSPFTPLLLSCEATQRCLTAEAVDGIGLLHKVFAGEAVVQSCTKTSIRSNGTTGPKTSVRLSPAESLQQLSAVLLMEAHRGSLRKREEDELAMVDVNVGNAPEHGSPGTGGFSEAGNAVEVGKSGTHHFLQASLLEAALPPNLFRMWTEARAAWLKLVAADWSKMCRRRPDRKDFSWDNQGEMNRSFFELCDVATAVMKEILGRDDATKVEESKFWLAFAAHLYDACESELKMAKDAMSLKKLNVKLKDHSFGSTRYFKDMPPEEQERRLLRKKRIEEARQRRAPADGEQESRTWLDIDHFEYQTEESLPAKDGAIDLEAKSASAAQARAATLHAHERQLNENDTATGTHSSTGGRSMVDEGDGDEPMAVPPPEYATLRFIVVGPSASSGPQTMDAVVAAVDQHAAVVEELTNTTAFAKLEVARRCDALNCDPATVRRDVSTYLRQAGGVAGHPATTERVTFDLVLGWMPAADCATVVTETATGGYGGKAVSSPTTSTRTDSATPSSPTAAVTQATKRPRHNDAPVDIAQSFFFPRQRKPSQPTTERQEEEEATATLASGPTHAKTVRLQVQVLVVNGVNHFLGVEENDTPDLAAFGAADVVILNRALSSLPIDLLSGTTVQRLVARASTLCKQRPGVVAVVEPEGRDAYHYMLRPDDRTQSLRLMPHLIPVLASAVHARLCSQAWTPTSVLAPEDVERLVLLQPDAKATARLPSKPGESKPRDFLGIHRLPGSPLGTKLYFVAGGHMPTSHEQEERDAEN